MSTTITTPQPPAPKNEKPFYKKWWFIVLAVIVVLIVIASASGGSTEAGSNNDGNTGQTNTDTGADGDDPAPEAKPEKPKPDNSTKTKNGPLTWGNWQSVGPVTPKADMLNDYVLAMRVKNIGDSADEGYFTVTVLKGQNILGTLDCSTSTVAPGQIATSQCSSLDKYAAGWTEITVEDGF